MACSKLFSGNLPELINEVIQYFRYDYRTLRLCILVNRLWCRLAIPLLWEDPFSIKVPKNYHFIEIYLHNLSDDDKTKLNEYVTLNNLLPSNTLFNYPKFIQRLDTNKICNSIENWTETVMTSTTQGNTNSLYSNMTNFTILIYKLLFLVFVRNEVNLHSFEVKVNKYEEFRYFDEIFELILQNPNFVYNIKNFKFDFDQITENIAKFVELVYSNCNSISSLHFIFPTHYNNYSLIEKNLSQIIKSQENLKMISFCYNNFPLCDSLLSLTNTNCSNTLNTIIFYFINFTNIVVLSDAFNQLNVLESIHIIYCFCLDSKFIQQINNITKPFKLKSLFMYKSDEILESLIRKSGNYLENLEIIKDDSQKLLRLIIKYCSKIKYLGPTWLCQQNVYLLFDFIENITQNLNYLSIDYLFNIHYNSIILQNLGQVLPFKLEYLKLCLTINTSDLKIFLKNSQNAFIKKLLIKNMKREKSQDIFPCIKEYIMKKKRIKYLAILETFCGKDEDLFSQKDKVKEFKLYDVQVQYYDDLLIDIYDFVKFNTL